MLSGLGSMILGSVMLFAQAGGAVSANAGPLEGRGTLKDGDGRSGVWSVQAVLKGGSFTGEASITLGEFSVTALLLPGRSFVENGKCYFAFEKDRARATLGGPCSADSISGKFDGFLPGQGAVVGEMTGTLRFGKAAAAPKSELPVGKLTCAWWETRVTYKSGELNSRELRPSNMGTLTLLPGGNYRTANTSGKFVKEGARIRLTSGAFRGAIGQLRADRSGEPAVYFELDENKRANGVHIIDPATTSCTKARS